MRMRYAKKLDNGDQVEVRLGPGEWVPGCVLGSPRMVDGATSKRLIIPVMSRGGFMEVDYTDVR